MREEPFGCEPVSSPRRRSRHRVRRLAGAGSRRPRPEARAGRPRPPPLHRRRRPGPGRAGAGPARAQPQAGRQRVVQLVRVPREHHRGAAHRERHRAARPAAPVSRTHTCSAVASRCCLPGPAASSTRCAGCGVRRCWRSTRTSCTSAAGPDPPGWLRPEELQSTEPYLTGIRTSPRPSHPGRTRLPPRISKLFSVILSVVRRWPPQRLQGAPAWRRPVRTCPGCAR